MRKYNVRGRHFGWNLHWLAVLLFCAIPMSRVQGQITTGDIVGSITDSSGASIPGAKVAIRNLGTNENRATESGVDGSYVFNLLPNGHYSVTVNAHGFKAFLVQDIALAVGDRIRVNAQLVPGGASETITVNSEPAALETEASSVQGLISQTAVEDLPLNGRDIFNLVTQAPGVNIGLPNSIGSGQRPDDRRQSSNLSANGQDDLMNNYEVDGLDNNERQGGSAGVRPSIDGISEVQVFTNDYSAELGRAAGAVVDIITKSGTNKFHGSAYEYFRNNIFDASDYFAVGGNPEYRQNQYGGSIGGPIKDKTFFFGDFEQYRIVQGIVQTTTVPTLFEEQNPGNFSDIAGPVMTPGQISSTGLNYFSMYPAPNKPGTILVGNLQPVNNYSSSFPKTQNSTSADVRVDHHFNDSNSFFARYDYNPVSTFLPGVLPSVQKFGATISPGGNPWAFDGSSDDNSQGIQLNYVHLFSSKLLLELKSGYTRIQVTTLPLNFGTNMSSKFGVLNSNFNQVSSALAAMWMNGGDYASLGDGFFIPDFFTNNIFQYNGALTWTRNSHNFKFGAALIRRQLHYGGQGWSPQGGFVFNTNGAESLLAGDPVYSERGNQLQIPNYRFWEPSVYAQDDWHIKRWLTLNLGVRYEIYTPTVEANNNQSNFDLATLQVVQATSSNRTMGVQTPYNDVSPRVGFSASLPLGVVVRGGFGISYYSAETGTGILDPNPPNNYSCMPCYGAIFPDLILPTASSITNPAGDLYAVAPNFSASYIEGFNLFAQRAFGQFVATLGYVGEMGRHLLYISPADLPAPPGPGNPQPSLVYATQLPNVSGINYYGTSGTSQYHALQASLIRHYSNGLEINANYNWAHDTTDAPTRSGAGAQAGLVRNDPKYDWGNADIDIPQRIAGTITYELPFAKSSTGLNAVLAKGWQANLIAFWQSGLPYTVESNTDFINLPNVSSERPNQIASPKIGKPTLNDWFNTAAFAHQTLGTPGDEEVNQLHGPSVRRVDLSAVKDFQMSEQLKLQFRAECYNISNTPNFGTPASTFGSPGFGSISSTQYGINPRQYEFVMKAIF